MTRSARPRLSPWSPLLLLIALACGNDRVAAVEKPPALVPRQSTALFNGTNLAGFHTWLVDSGRTDGRNVFTVTNGLLRISGDGLGYLATTNSYRDYHLIVEFSWGSVNWPWGERIAKARDSGVFLHATGPDGNSHDGQGAFMAAIECQVMEGCVGDFLLIRGNDPDGILIEPQVTVESSGILDADRWPWWKQGGPLKTLTRWGRVNRLGKSPEWRDQFGFKDPGSLEAAAGEWNRLECRCDGGRITITLNGRVVNEATKVYPAEGRILLQCEGSEIFFRRVELQPLKPIK